MMCDINWFPVVQELEKEGLQNMNQRLTSKGPFYKVLDYSTFFYVECTNGDFPVVHID